MKTPFLMFVFLGLNLAHAGVDCAQLGIEKHLYKSCTKNELVQFKRIEGSDLLSVKRYLFDPATQSISSKDGWYFERSDENAFDRVNLVRNWNGTCALQFLSSTSSRSNSHKIVGLTKELDLQLGGDFENDLLCRLERKTNEASDDAVRGYFQVATGSSPGITQPESGKSSIAR